jgi:hypothetical protein
MMKGKYLLAVLWCFCLANCAPLVLFGAGTAFGVSGYKYYKGALTVIYQASYMETWDATLRALEGMNLQILSKEHDLTAGKIKAKRADKKPVNVSLEYKSAQKTEVVIRAGYLGDQDASMAIKEQIRKELFKE